MAKKLSDELEDGLDAPPKVIKGSDVKEAVQKIRAAKEAIAGPTGQKGDVVKKLREDGLDMGALNVLATLDSASEDKRASFWATFGPGIEAMSLGPPKDLFTGTGADDKNAKGRRGKVKAAVNGELEKVH